MNKVAQPWMLISESKTCPKCGGHMSSNLNWSRCNFCGHTIATKWRLWKKRRKIMIRKNRLKEKRKPKDIFNTADRLRQARINAQLSMGVLADRLNFTPLQISNIENGVWIPTGKDREKVEAFIGGRNE